ncbi:MAG: hypothetical protein EOM58_00940 [Clostridia bacterium]|nr:hypothetical protein [Clostridia bacterium]
MSSGVFELISQGLRYWFVLLGIIIVWRTLKWALQDHRAYGRMIKALPDAGLIGEIVSLSTGESQPLPREGVIGSSKSCDIRFSGIRSREMEYVFIEGRGVEIIPAHRQHEISLNGEEVGTKAFASHGSRLNLPGYTLRFRLFSGLNVPDIAQEAAYQPAEEGWYTPEGELGSLMNAGMPLPDQLPGLHDHQMPSAEPQLAPVEQPYENPIAQPYQYDAYSLQQPVYGQPAPAPQSLQPAQQAWNPDMTWQYAVPPPEVFASAAAESQYQPSLPLWEQEYHQEPAQPRKRRSKRHEK